MPQDRLDLARLYREHRLPLVRMAVLWVDDRASAEDVVHDAFLNLHRNADRLREPAAAVAYLRTSVVNGARSTLRRRATVRTYMAASQPDDSEAADAELMLAEEHRVVLAAVRQLPERQQEVVKLRYWSNLSEAEIAAALGITRGSVKSHASRAIDKLEEILGGAQ